MSAPTARDLVALYDQRIAMTKAMAGLLRPTAEMAQAVLDKGAELDAACEEFRRANHPRRRRVIVGLRQVWVVSRTGRNADLVFDGNAP